MDEEGFLWTGHGTRTGNLVIDWQVSVKDARERAQQERTRTEARFRAAPFALYGLAPEWDRRSVLGWRLVGRITWAGENEESVAGARHPCAGRGTDARC